MKITEDQWAKLGAWITKEALEYGNGMISRCGYITLEEQDAREAFGLNRVPDGYLENLDKQRQERLNMFARFSEMRADIYPNYQTRREMRDD